MGGIQTSHPEPTQQDDSETVAALTVTGLTASRLVATNASKTLESVTNLASWVAGTSNQVTVTNDGDGTITLALPQNIHTAASPTFAGATFTGTTAARLLASDGSKALASVANLQSWIAGTANQVVTADDGDGTLTLSLPQSIGTSSTPSFAGLTLTGPLIGPLGSAGAPSFTFVGQTSKGLYYEANIAGPAFSVAIGASGLYIPTGGGVFFLNGTVAGGSSDSTLVSVSSGIVALVNGTTAQELRVYGTTTGPKYATLHHNGTNAVVGANSGDLKLRVGGTDAWNVSATTGRLEAISSYGFSHGIAALATGATEGFFHIQSCAGTPSGTPASIPTGQIPMVYDSSAHKIWFYSGSWRGVSVT
jgi:hypothetical protein